MQELEVTFGRAARIWWAWCWRTLLFSLLLGLAVGLLVGVAAALLGIPGQRLAPFNMAAGFGVGTVVSIWMMAKTLQRPFASFRIALLAYPPEPR